MSFNIYVRKNSSDLIKELVQLVALAVPVEQEALVELGQLEVQELLEAQVEPEVNTFYSQLQYVLIYIKYYVSK